MASSRTAARRTVPVYPDQKPLPVPFARLIYMDATGPAAPHRYRRYLHIDYATRAEAERRARELRQRSPEVVITIREVTR